MICVVMMREISYYMYIHNRSYICVYCVHVYKHVLLLQEILHNDYT